MLRSRAHLGFTVVELMVGIAVLAFLLTIAGPSFATWLQNSQIRNMSEAIKDGLELARAEAVRRNAQVRFELVNSLTATCALSTSASNWIVSMDGAVGACDSTNMADAAAPAAPRVIQSRGSSDGSGNAVIAASSGAAFDGHITFNGLGRMTYPTADVAINVTNPTGGACMASSGPMRCLRVTVGAGGQIRMCDPRTSFNGTSEGC